VRTIGIVRARAKIGMMNLVYNMCRLIRLERLTADRGCGLPGAERIKDTENTIPKSVKANLTCPICK